MSQARAFSNEEKASHAWIAVDDYQQRFGTPSNDRLRTMVDMLVDVGHSEFGAMHFERAEEYFRDEVESPVEAPTQGVPARRVQRARLTLAERSAQGDEVMKTYAAAVGTELDDAATDLIADCMLLCNQEGWDFDAVKEEVELTITRDEMRLPTSEQGQEPVL